MTLFIPIIVTIIYLLITGPIVLLGKAFAAPIVSNPTIISVVNIIYIVSILSVFLGTIYYPAVSSSIVTLLCITIFAWSQGYFNSEA